MEMLRQAIRIATNAHDGQFDKGGRPYILHPMRVMLAGGTTDEMIVGVLHDVVEDTPVTLADLAAAGFSPAVLDAVDAVTRRQTETYAEYIDRVERAGRLAIRVKLNDLADNMSLARMAYLPVDVVSGLMKRYIPAHDRLTKFLARGAS